MQPKLRYDRGKPDHYYVFEFRVGNPIPLYERTCGTERAANARVRELQKRGHDAYWTTKNTLPHKFYY